MSAFEWVLIVVVFVGVVIPIWLFFAAAFVAAKRPRATDPSARFFAYKQLIEYIFSHMEGGDVVIENGALFAATVRELKNYPEYRDLTVLLLEALTITGSKKFDGVLRNELTSLEDYLLRMDDR